MSAVRKKRKAVEVEKKKPQLVKVKRYCSKCGCVLGDGNKSGICWSCKKESLQRWREKQYVDLSLTYDRDGNPKCPECGCSMIFRCNQWQCENDVCSIIYVTGRQGRFKIVRDSVLYSKELEVVS